MQTLALTPHLHLIPGRNPRFPTFAHCNSFLIRDEVTALVDTTAGASLLPLAAAGTVERLLHTHVHPDHINYDYLFPGVPVTVPVYAAPALSSLAAFMAYGGHGHLGPAVGAYCAREQGWLEREYQATYRDGDVLTFGRTRLRAIHAPGHSVDHMLLYHEESGILICTDIDLSPWGPWYGNPGSDIDQFVASVGRVQELAPRVLVSSHMPAPVAEDIPGALAAYLAVIEKRDRRIVDLLAAPMTLAQVVEHHPLYRTYPHPEPLLHYFETTMVAKHLERLVRRGEVVAEGHLYRRA